MPTKQTNVCDICDYENNPTDHEWNSIKIYKNDSIVPNKHYMMCEACNRLVLDYIEKLTDNFFGNIKHQFWSHQQTEK